MAKRRTFVDEQKVRQFGVACYTQWYIFHRVARDPPKASSTFLIFKLYIFVNFINFTVNPEELGTRTSLWFKRAFISYILPDDFSPSFCNVSNVACGSRRTKMVRRESRKLGEIFWRLSSRRRKLWTEGWREGGGVGALGKFPVRRSNLGFASSSKQSTGSLLHRDYY